MHVGCIETPTPIRLLSFGIGAGCLAVAKFSEVQLQYKEIENKCRTSARGGVGELHGLALADPLALELRLGLVRDRSTALHSGLQCPVAAPVPGHSANACAARNHWDGIAVARGQLARMQHPVTGARPQSCMPRRMEQVASRGVTARGPKHREKL